MAVAAHKCPPGLATAGVAWLAAGLGLIGFEAYAIAHRRCTLSEAAWHTCTRYPLLPLAAGVLFGHFFWQSAAVYEEEGAEP